MDNDYEVCPNCHEQMLTHNGEETICLNCDYSEIRPREDFPPQGSRLIAFGFAVTRWDFVRHNGRRYRIRTCYEFVSGKWEGFTSLQEVPIGYDN